MSEIRDPLVPEHIDPDTKEGWAEFLLEGRDVVANPAGEVEFIDLSRIANEPVSWLWPKYLAKGKLHLIAGAPGTGKTTVALTIAATLATGGRWPTGEQAPTGKVLIWSGEDGLADTIRPRLEAAGYLGTNVFAIGHTREDEPRPFDPATDVEVLERAIREYGDVDLLIVDPIVVAVSGDSHKNAEVRRGLQPLVALGERTGCAVLGVTHFSKGTAGRNPTERVTGSIAFAALARIVLATAKAEDGSYILAISKSNIGPDIGGFGYTLAQTEVSRRCFVSRVVWGEALEGSAQQLLAGAEDQADLPIVQARAWLREMLAGAEVPVREMKAEAAAAGFSWRTIERAKSDLEVIARPIARRSEKGGVSAWVWALPSRPASLTPPRHVSLVGGLTPSLTTSTFPGASAGQAATQREKANGHCLPYDRLPDGRDPLELPPT